MEKVKRCPFCGHKLDAEGYCTNKNCSDYVRRKATRRKNEVHSVARKIGDYQEYGFEYGNSFKNCG